MVKINSIGEILVDMIGKNEEGLKQNPEFQRRPGGAPANLAVAASKLGADTTMTATVGNDYFGELLVEKLEEEDVNTENIREIDDNTTLAFVALNQNAEPEFSFHRGADMKISMEQIQGEHEVIHIGSLPLTHQSSAENIISTIRETDSRVSFDPNLRKEFKTGEYFQTLKEVISHTDVLFAAEDEVEQLGGEDKILENVNEIVVSQGSRGAKVITSEQEHHAEPPEVDVVDTTGAGDALAGAYLAYRHEGVDQALVKAVHAASISTTRTGAMAAVPTEKKLKESLEN